MGPSLPKPKPKIGPKIHFQSKITSDQTNDYDDQQVQKPTEKPGFLTDTEFPGNNTIVSNSNRTSHYYDRSIITAETSYLQNEPIPGLRPEERNKPLKAGPRSCLLFFCCSN